MYRFQTLTIDQIKNAVLCFADRISCSYCPIKDECITSCPREAGITCEKMLMNYLSEEIPQPKTPDFYDGFNEGFRAGYAACKKDIINKLQKGREKNENTR